MNNNKIFCVICLVSILILIWSLSRNNLVEEFNNDEIVFSLTSLPWRLKHLVKNLDNIRNNIPNAEIHLNLPKIVKRTNDKWDLDKIPEHIKNDKNIKIFLIDDIGPVSKLLPTLKRINNPNTLIITIDDDIIYDIDYLKKFIDLSKKYSNNILSPKIGAFFDINLKQFKYLNELNKKNNFFYLVEGFRGIGYPKLLMTNRIINQIEKLSKLDNCFTSDDLIISYVLYKNNIKIKDLNLDTSKNDINLSESDKRGLKKQNHFITYDKCFKNIINNLS